MVKKIDMNELDKNAEQAIVNPSSVVPVTTLKMARKLAYHWYSGNKKHSYDTLVETAMGLSFATCKERLDKYDALALTVKK